MEAQSGIGFIKPPHGLAALEMATSLHDGPAVLGVVPLVWSKVLRPGAPVPPFLTAFAPKDVSPVVIEADNGDEPEPTEDDDDATVPSGVSLEQVLATVKRTSGGSINADAPLMESGVDSLGAVELRNQLQ
eukprot:3894246-Prymnesium_polylepis.1